MIKNIIFDLGGVLIDWNPRYLYSEVFESEDEMEFFLSEICSMDWNEQQDAGRSWQDATEELVARHPKHEHHIRLYRDRWTEMLGDAIAENVDLLHHLLDHSAHDIYALTNWSAETFPIALERYDFLHRFMGIVVSGEEKMKKPDSRIYSILLERYGLVAEESLFIDDNLHNVQAAIDLGIRGIHFTNHQTLRHDLQSLEVLVA